MTGAKSLQSLRKMIMRTSRSSASFFFSFYSMRLASEADLPLGSRGEQGMDAIVRECLDNDLHNLETLRDTLAKNEDVADYIMVIKKIAALKVFLDNNGTVSRVGDKTGDTNGTAPVVIGRCRGSLIYRDAANALLSLDGRINNRAARKVMQSFYPRAGLTLNGIVSRYFNFLVSEGRLKKFGSPPGTYYIVVRDGRVSSSVDEGGDMDRGSSLSSSYDKYNLIIKENVVKDILKLFEFNCKDVKKVIKKYYPKCAQSTIETYISSYIRYALDKGLIEDSSSIVSKGRRKFWIVTNRVKPTGSPVENHVFSRDRFISEREAERDR